MFYGKYIPVVDNEDDAFEKDIEADGPGIVIEVVKNIEMFSKGHNLFFLFEFEGEMDGEIDENFVVFNIVNHEIFLLMIGMRFLML